MNEEGRVLNLNNDTWEVVSIPPCAVAYETKDYLVIITPSPWRKQAEKLKRVLYEFTIVNKTFGTLEGGLDHLPGSIFLTISLQESLDNTRKGQKNASIVGFPSKDSPK